MPYSGHRYAAGRLHKKEIGLYTGNIVFFSYGIIKRPEKITDNCIGAGTAVAHTFQKLRNDVSEALLQPGNICNGS